MKKIVKWVTVIAALSGILIVGVRRLNKRNLKTSDIEKDDLEEVIDKEISNFENVNHEDDELNIYKERTSETLKERHEAASDVLKESIQNIVQKSEVNNEDLDVLNCISDELDELLGEE